MLPQFPSGLTQTPYQSFDESEYNGRYFANHKPQQNPYFYPNSPSSMVPNHPNSPNLYYGTPPMSYSPKTQQGLIHFFYLKFFNFYYIYNLICFKLIFFY